MTNSTANTTNTANIAIAANTANPTAYRDQCLALLEGMNAGNGQSWEAQWKLYDLLLSRWDEATTRRTVEWAVFHCKWRPSVAELREIAANLCAPVPTADEALEELRTLIAEFGRYAAPHPDYPERFPYMAGPGIPVFTHPLIESTVRRLGGYIAICDGEAQYQEGGLSGAFRAVYNRAAESWRDRVADALMTGDRPSLLFDTYPPLDTSSRLTLARQQLALREKQQQARKDIGAFIPRDSGDTWQIAERLSNRFSLPESFDDAVEDSEDADDAD